MNEVSVISGLEFSRTIIGPPLFMKRKEYIDEKRTDFSVTERSTRNRIICGIFIVMV